MFAVSPCAARFYKESMYLQDGDALKVFVKYGGEGLGGFSLGIEKADSCQTDLKQSVEGIYFYAEPGDEWLVNKARLTCGGPLNEPIFLFSA